MATVADLKSQLETALGALSTAFPVLDSGTLDSQRVERSSYRAMIRISGVETATAGSNLTITIATVDDVAADSFWTALAAVRSSPVDVAVESDLERVGEVLRYTIRADCALEG